MAREAREVWAKRVERLADSGLTAKEYAAEIGVNANTLAGWRWRLRGGRDGDAAAGQAAGEVPPVGVAQTKVIGKATAGLERQARSDSVGRAAITPMKFVELTTAPVARRVLFE